MITLDNVAGYKEEKDEIRKIVGLLKNYEEYKKDGIYVPKGLILQGPPGCGKTLFAHAIAGESGLPLYVFSIKATMAESLEALKNIFIEAKKHLPAIVYIDEIDKIVGEGFLSSDDTRSALQLLLNEIDGSNNSQGILIIASTNYYEDLPRSLVRSGRMDKKIFIPKPDLESRIAITEFYIKDKKPLQHISVKNLAIKLRGFSGADIKTLINNACIEAKTLDREITLDDISNLIDEMAFEDIGRHWKSNKVLNKVLIHEAGHALVRYALCGAPSAISGVAHAESAGATTFDPLVSNDDITVLIEKEEEARNTDKNYLLNLIASFFGGAAAEKVFFGNYDTGAADDISKACDCFTLMGNSWFLSSKFIGFNPRNTISDYLIRKFFNKRDRIFKKQFKKALSIIKKNKNLINDLAEKAAENDDVLSAAQVEEIIDKSNFIR